MRSRLMHLVAKRGGNRQREVEEVPGVVEGASDPERNLSGRSSEEVHGAADVARAPSRLWQIFSRFSADVRRCSQMFADFVRFCEHNIGLALSDTGTAPVEVCLLL